MSRESSDIYGVVHRCLLQILAVRGVISKKELDNDILSKLNSKYETTYTLESVIGSINDKIRDFGFSIKEILCDDGVTYYCYINTINDSIANSCSLSPMHLKVAKAIIMAVTEEDNVKYVDVISDLKSSSLGTAITSIANELFTNHWFYRYRCRNTETIIGGPRLILELGRWLVDTVHISECPFCMDPVVGGLHCPHGCGAVVHRSCAYRSLHSMQSTDDSSDKGICPNCHKRWIADLSNFTENGAIYRK